MALRYLEGLEREEFERCTVGLLGGGKGSSVISGPRSVRKFFWVRSFVSLPGGLTDWAGMVQFTCPSDPFKGGLGTRCLFMLLSWYEVHEECV